MTITAKYTGKCARCGGRINPGDQITWDKSTRRTEHVTCPENVAPATTGTSVRTNRKPGRCELCGHHLQAGQGRLKYCIEDSGCPVHHDYAGYHLYCLDEVGCKQRQEEAQKQREALRAEVAALQATITDERVSDQGAEQIAFVARGSSVYLSHVWYRLADGTVAVSYYKPVPFDEWESITVRTTATLDQVLAAKKSGALAYIKL